MYIVRLMEHCKNDGIFWPGKKCHEISLGETSVHKDYGNKTKPGLVSGFEYGHLANRKTEKTGVNSPSSF